MELGANSLLWAISVNNKPQHHRSQEIKMALSIVRALKDNYFDTSIQRDHLIKSLEIHLANTGDASNTFVAIHDVLAQST